MLATLFDHLAPPASTAFEIRAPRRDDGYAAQVWCDAGHWLIGSGYATTREARAAAQAFAATGPEPPAPGQSAPPNWVRRRHERGDDAP